jgi:NAD(P)-dependent dehydrogenase (short-subunit alcohol dehydrogenase family)
MATDEFAGKRALVTGGTKGMGEAIVARSAPAGRKSSRPPAQRRPRAKGLICSLLPTSAP